METAIVDSPYRAVTRKLVNFWCDSIPNSWIGRQLPGLFQDFGLLAVQVVPLTLRMTAYSQWNDVFQIEVTVERARRANVVSAGEAALWLGQLRDPIGREDSPWRSRCSWSPGKAGLMPRNSA